VVDLTDHSVVKSKSELTEQFMKGNYLERLQLIESLKSKENTWELVGEIIELTASSILQDPNSNPTQVENIRRIINLHSENKFNSRLTLEALNIILEIV